METDQDALRLGEVHPLHHGHGGDGGGFLEADVFRMGAETEGAQPENPVAGGEARDRLAYGFDHARQFVPEDGVPGLAQSAHQADDEVFGLAEAAVGAVDRGGMDADKDFVVLGDGLGDVFQVKDVRRAVNRVDAGLHG